MMKCKNVQLCCRKRQNSNYSHYQSIFHITRRVRVVKIKGEYSGTRFAMRFNRLVTIQKSF